MAEIPKTVTANELADLLAITANRVQALAREGVIPRTGRRYPLRDGIRAYCEWSRLHPSGRQIADPTLADQKLRLAREQADKIALQNARARGELLDAAEVAREWRGLAVDLRARLLAVPPRITSALGLDRDTSARLDRELRASLEDIADEP